MRKNSRYIATLSAMFFIFLLSGWLNNMEAQQIRSESDAGYPFVIWMEPNTDDFASIQQQAEAWFEGKDKGRGSGYKHWKRWEYINQYRLTPEGKITNHAARTWDAFMESGGNSSRITNGSWYFLAARDWTNGPSGYNPGIGRVNCIAFHPANSSILWVGLPSGGLWKTEDHGTTWAPLTDGIPSIGVSGIVIHPTNPNIIWILTGDGDAGDTKSIGVLKSTNGGATWYTTGLSWAITDDIRGYKLIMHPTNTSELWAVTNGGLYKTTNGGTSWTQMISGSFRDLEFKPGDPSIMYLCTSNTFYRSTDSGSNWTIVSSGLPTGENRIAIGVSPANSSYVYLMCGPATGTGSYKGLYRSLDSGLNFVTQSTTPNILGYSNTGNDSDSQSSYDLAIAVSRLDHADMIIGGINTWRSLNYGVNWTLTSMWNTPAGAYTHADIHALEINPLNNYVYCGSDGGIFYTTNFGTTWTDLSSDLEPTQWYKIAGYPTNSNLIIGGTQDNGSNKYTGSTTIMHMYGADGMDCMIDPTNSDIMYFSTQNGGLRKSTDGGNTSSGISPAGGPWVTPYIMNPSNSSIIYGGFGAGVYKSTNGGSGWTNMGGVSNSATMVHGVNNTNVIYAGGGTLVRRSADAGSTWTTISGGLSVPSGSSITCIELDHDNANQVWVTLSGYNAGQKVFKTENAAAATVVWTNISGTLPNTPVNCIETSNTGPDDAIYIGTDIGVFYRDAVLGDWVPFSNWLPTVPVFDLEINDISGLIAAGTYGRGLWESSLYSDCVTYWILSGQGAAGYSYYQASDSIRSTRQFTQGVGQEGIFKAAGHIRLVPGFNVAGGSTFHAFLGACGAGVPENESYEGGPVTGTYGGPMPELLKIE